MLILATPLHLAASCAKIRSQPTDAAGVSTGALSRGLSAAQPLVPDVARVASAPGLWRRI
jgi:hypothetical protein